MQLHSCVRAPVFSVAIGGDATLSTRTHAMQPEQCEGWAAQALEALYRVPSSGPGIVSLALAYLPLSGASAIRALGNGQQFQSLRCLRIEGCPWLCTESLEALKQMTEMRVLSFAGCRGLGSVAGYLWPMQKLHTLVLNDTLSSGDKGTSTRDVDMLMLSTSTSFYGLRRLHVERTDVSDRSLAVLAKRCVSLAELSLAGCGRITRQGVGALAKMPELSYLDVNATSADGSPALALVNSKGAQVRVGPLPPLAPLGQCTPNGVQLSTDQVAGSSAGFH